AKVKFCLTSGSFFYRRKANGRIRVRFALFGSQRFYRIHPSGAACREKTSEKRRSSEHQTCADERQGITRIYLIQDFGQNAPSGKRKKETDTDGEGRLEGALSHDKGEYVAPMCTQCHANSDLSGPTRNGISLHAINTDDC